MFLSDPQNRALRRETQLFDALVRSDAILNAQRRRISRDLRDSLGQFFTGLQMGLVELGKHASGNRELAARIEGLVALANAAAADLDSIAWEIRPAELGEDGFASAVSVLMEEWTARSGIAFDCHVELHDRALPSEIETALFRIRRRLCETS